MPPPVLGKGAISVAFVRPSVKRGIWHVPNYYDLPPCQISRLEECVAPAGRKTHFGPMSKCNTGMQRCAHGLPVIPGGS